MSEEKEKTKVEEPCEAEALEGEAPLEDAAPPPDAADEWREKYHRALAELDNYSKRVERTRSETHKFALEELMRDLLPVLDDLELAIGAEGDANAIREGVQLALKRALTVLGNKGLERIEALDKVFDPYVHEAMGCIPCEDKKAGTVIAEMTRGYRLHERVLRPSRVQIASEPPKPEEDEK